MLNRLNALPRDTRDTLFLLLVIGWVLLPQVAHLPVWCSTLAAGVLLWRAALAVRQRPLPSRWVLLVLLGVTASATLATHQTLLGQEAGVTLLVVLLSLKTLELRARRDAFVVFFLGFFCLLSNFFHSQSLLTAGNMLLGLIGLLTVLVNAHMPVGKPPLRRAAAMATKMALLGTPVMLVLFMLFPRMAPLWGMPSDGLAGRSGLSPSMQVGNIASLALDDSVAMRLEFEGIRPPQSQLYFRGPVLSRFDGREWQAQPLLDWLRPAADTQLSVSGPGVRYQVTLEPTRHPWLLLLEAAPNAPELPGYRTTLQADLQWRLDRPISERLRYQAQSYPQFAHGPRRRDASLAPFVQLPAGFNPRTQAMAERMRAEHAGDTSALVQAALTQLRTGGYTYTLEPGVTGMHSADEFWFDSKLGFCEHIASAFVILMRGMDVPARIVTGYQGGELNSVDEQWTVRQSDAHAWAEVWQEGAGWLRVDPTSAVSPGRTGAFQRLAAPPGVLGKTFGALSPTLVAQLRANWEAINSRWNQWVMNYSQKKQLDLLKNLGFESPSWQQLVYGLLGLLVTAALAGALLTRWERSPQDPWLRLLSRSRVHLQRLGIDSSAASSPRQLAQQVHTRFGTAGQALYDWLMALETSRYAKPGQAAISQAARLRQLKAACQALRGAPVNSNALPGASTPLTALGPIPSPIGNPPADAAL